MNVVKCKLTVLFEDPFWIGIYERQYQGIYEVAKITFGSEPKDYEIYSSYLSHWRNLRFSPSINIEAVDEKKLNPKRLQRTARRETEGSGIGTKAQKALKLQYEQNKLKKKVVSKEMKDIEKQKQFLLHQKKKLEKHKGH